MSRDADVDCGGQIELGHTSLVESLRSSHPARARSLSHLTPFSPIFHSHPSSHLASLPYHPIAPSIPFSFPSSIAPSRMRRLILLLFFGQTMLDNRMEVAGSPLTTKQNAAF